jgi:hypothetical protein
MFIRQGRAYLVDAFQGYKDLADSVNHLAGGRDRCYGTKRQASR